ncbi:MAG: glycosyltransferase family 2 protein [Candidatus Kariarchaeaceae archaeon]|jgi:glycosyltransferase involved in cell wall biosynthesis
MKNNDFPTVSVIAPCRNEVDFIEKTIKSIMDSDYPLELMEILVVDGMSTDGTREVLDKLAAVNSQIKVLDNPKMIVPTAMNIGVKAAKGDYIIRIDCHAQFPSNYISKCIEVSQRTQADNIGGYGKTLPGDDTPKATAIAAATSCRFGVGNSIFRLTGSEREVDTVPFGTYRKEVFTQIGLYDERLTRNQDIELNSRIRKAGGRIVISPEIELSYYNRATYQGLWQQAFNNGIWNPYTIWLAGGGLSLRHFVPLAFVIVGITLMISAIAWPPSKWILFGYILLYLLFAFTYAIKVSNKHISSIFLILWSFIILHIGYGMGSLWAVLTIPFKFVHWRKGAVGSPMADRKK